MSTVQAYRNTDVSHEQSIEEINGLFEKFGIEEIKWITFDPDNSYLVFGYIEANNRLVFKVNIPNIENNRNQSYRVLYHKLKALLIDLELGQKVFEVFSNNLVIGMENGRPISIKEKQSSLINDGKVEKLYLTLSKL